MNTIWGHSGTAHDDLQHPEDASAWLRAIGFEADAVTAENLADIRRLRDALRRTAAYATGDPRRAAASAMTDITEAVDAINDTLAGTRHDQLTLDKEGLSRRPVITDPFTEGLAAVGRAAVDLFTAPEPALRACLAPGCILYFVQSHPRREWCSVACGNRARAARHYRRHRTDPAQV